jgi:hypothetical protein
MRRISEMEIPVGLHPELSSDRVINGVSEASLAELLEESA